MITISQLYIYPIKSLAGIALNQAQLSSKGLEHDRRWLLVDKDGILITQRTHPKMVLFKTGITQDGIIVTFEGEEILVPFEPQSTRRLQANVWGDVFEVVEVSEPSSRWFTEKLSESVRLVFQPNDSFRQADQRYAKSPEDDVSAADGFPVLLISEESLADLNSKLTEPVEMLRFRPNIVVKGLPAFGEDALALIYSPDASLVGVKDCGRCIMINNDLSLGKLGKEPLKTLSRYRKVGNKVLFGRNFIPVKQGILKVAEPITQA